jgi:hypothetical protein
VKAGLRLNFGQTVQDLGAEHSALEVDQRHHERTLAEILAERDVLTCFVAKMIVQRKRRIEPLIDAGVLEISRGILGGGTQGFLSGVLLGAGERTHSDQAADKQ